MSEEKTTEIQRSVSTNRNVGQGTGATKRL